MGLGFRVLGRVGGFSLRNIVARTGVMDRLRSIGELPHFQGGALRAVMWSSEFGIGG